MSHSQINDKVAEVVRMEAARKRKSGSQLAREAGVTQSYVSARMRAVTEMSIADLELFSRLLDVPIADLLPREDPPGTGRYPIGNHLVAA